MTRYQAGSRYSMESSFRCLGSGVCVCVCVCVCVFHVEENGKTEFQCMEFRKYQNSLQVYILQLLTPSWHILKAKRQAGA